MSNASNYIATDRCDSCGKRRPCAIFLHYGSPVLAQCQSCDPKNFEEVSRHAIDRWLAGEATDREVAGR